MKGTSRRRCDPGRPPPPAAVPRASMKGTSRRRCDLLPVASPGRSGRAASMKGTSRRRCDSVSMGAASGAGLRASMKGTSRRRCDVCRRCSRPRRPASLNEGHLPKEVRPQVLHREVGQGHRSLNEGHLPKEVRRPWHPIPTGGIFLASMKGTSRRRCDPRPGRRADTSACRLNEGHLPKEVRPGSAPPYVTRRPPQ